MIALCVMLSAWFAADVQPLTLREPLTSYSGQFLVHGTVSSEPAPIRTSTNDPVYVSLEPQTLTVMAERVKEAFLLELKEPHHYRDKIFLLLTPTRDRQASIGIVSTRFQDRWGYTVHVPAIVDQERLVRGLLQAVMTEYVNRSGSRAGEIPTWCFEGLHQEILNTALPTYLVSTRVLMAEVRGYNRVENSRQLLRAGRTLSFHDLSFPSVDFNNPQQAALYRANAHIFVHELLQLPHGPALLAAFLRKLPEHLNWQSAFLEVYKSSFPRLLDVEKWWALHQVDIRGRDAREIWPLQTSVQKLQAVLLTSMDVRADTNSLPVRREVALTEVFAIENDQLQREVLSQKIPELHFLAHHMETSIAALAMHYRQTLITYLAALDGKSPHSGLKQQPGAQRAALIADTTSTLRELDRQVLRVLQQASTP